MAKAAKLGQIYVEVNARLDRLEKDLKKGRRVSERQTKMMQRTFDKINFNRARTSLTNFNRLLVTVAAGYGLKRIASSALDTAASFEAMEIKLEQLTRGRGQETLDELNAWALEMPVNTQKAVDSFVMMQALGLDPTIEKMQILTDVASILGEDTLQRIALQLGQAASKGKIMGQELMVLGEIGLNVRKYLKDAFGMTVEELQKSGTDINKILQAIWDGMERDFGGSAKRMMGSWQGLRTVFKSYVVELERQVMAAGVFEALKEHLQDVNKYLGDWIKNNDKLIKQKVEDTIYKIEDGLKNIVSIYEQLPEGIIGATGAGIVGRILFGSWKIGAFITGLSLLNTHLKKFYDENQKRAAGVVALHGSTEEILAALEGPRELASARITKDIEEVDDKIKSLKKTIEGLKDVDIVSFVGTNIYKKEIAELEKELVELKKTRQELVEQKDLIFIVPDEQEIQRIQQYESLMKSVSKVTSDMPPPPPTPKPTMRWTEKDQEKWLDYEIKALDEYDKALVQGHEKLLQSWKEYHQKIIDDDKQFWKDWRQQTISELNEYDEALIQGHEDTEQALKKQQEEKFNSMVELSERTAWAMQENFSNIFYDAITGELDSFEDYTRAIFKSIARAWSDLMGQMLAQSIFGKDFGGGGWLSGIVDWFSSEKGNVFGPSGVIPFGQGGVVSKPTIFPFASGGVGVMGERGPEAIMPLKRTSSGELGVKSEQSQSTSGDIYIYAMDSESFNEFADRNKDVFVNQTIGAIQRGNRGLISNIRMIK